MGAFRSFPWQCDSSVANSDHVIAVGNPAEDAVITATAKALAQYPGPGLSSMDVGVFNDLANHNTCLGWTSGTPTPQIYNDFIGAWQHIWNLFQSAGATNVDCGIASGGSKYAPDGFYPGNAYVD